MLNFREHEAAGCVWLTNEPCTACGRNGPVVAFEGEHGKLFCNEECREAAHKRETLH